MSELTISSSNWLALSLRNSGALVFNLAVTSEWQCLKPATADEQPAATGKKQVADDDDESAGGLNRNLIRFTPDGQKLAINGQNKQIYIYGPSFHEKTQMYWELQRTITVKKRASAFDLTNEWLLIADKSGDVYKVDLSTPAEHSATLTLAADDCIMGHLSMLLDIAFLRSDNNQSFILTADRDEKIRLSHYPNAYNIEGYCLGHTEFVSHVKRIDRNHILSTSGDGTLRLWHLPDCVQLNVFPSTLVTSSATHLFYRSSNELKASLPYPSPINDSIWKMDLVSSGSPNSDMSNVFIALSTFGSRVNSIYLTTLANLTQSSNEHRRLSFDLSYGTIVDYCFPSKENISNTQCDLYILFDSHTLLRVNIIPILSSNQLDQSTANLDVVNSVLAKEDFHTLTSETMFKQLFKARGEPGDSSYHKRKNERLEQQEQKRNRKTAPIAANV